MGAAVGAMDGDASAIRRDVMLEQDGYGAP
jgi:hypothetical protein